MVQVRGKGPRFRWSGGRPTETADRGDEPGVGDAVGDGAGAPVLSLATGLQRNPVAFILDTEHKIRSTAMANRQSKPPKGERLEADGETHRRDCECARCEAGFTPTEGDRVLASKRLAAKQGRRAAVRALERKKELARQRQLDLAVYFRQGNAQVDAEVQRLRGLRNKALGDRRMDEFLRLRRNGLSLEVALAEVDRRFPPGGPSGSDNDNGRDHSEAELAAHRVGLLFP